MTAPGISHNKVCNLEDFRSEELQPVIREIFSAGRVLPPDFPARHELRKQWEVAMAVRAFRDSGVLGPTAEVLGVAAGSEPTAFWLTREARWVFATDLYLAPGVWGPMANAEMLTDPGLYWRGPWNPRRLVVQHMDALDLRYEDDSFDAVFCSSSIEHFGGLESASASLDEMCRVLRPGGVASISTEFRIEGPPPGLPECLMLTAGELTELFLGGRDWEMLSPLDDYISQATLRTEEPQEEVVADIERHSALHGRLVLHEVSFRRYPQIVLRLGEHLFTSVHLSLRKRGGR